MTRKATEESTAVAVGNIQTAIANAPSFIQDAGEIGNENIGAEDLSIPRLMLLQDLSPEIKKTNKKYVEGAAPGKIINSVTKELYDSIRLVNLYQQREFPIFGKRTMGGGFKGIKGSKEEAAEFVRTAPDGNSMEVVETISHFVLILDAHNNPVGEAIIPMTSTKISFSRQWNSMIKLRKGARFGSIWTLGVAVQRNAKNQEFYNYTIIGDAQWITDESLFKLARAKHEVVKQMPSVKASEEEDQD